MWSPCIHRSQTVHQYINPAVLKKLLYGNALSPVEVV